jgi:hypothetical protein
MQTAEQGYLGEREVVLVKTLPTFLRTPFLLRFGVWTHGHRETPLAFLGAAFLKKEK